MSQKFYLRAAQINRKNVLFTTLVFRVINFLRELAIPNEKIDQKILI